MVTAVIINKIPRPIEKVNISPNTAIPTITAVTGSMAPNTEVRVEPMFLMASIKDKLDTMVGIIARSKRFPAINSTCHPIPYLLCILTMGIQIYAKRRSNYYTFYVPSYHHDYHDDFL